MDAQLRGRGRRRFVFDERQPAVPIAPKPLVTQGVRSEAPPPRDETMDDWMRGRRGEGVWDRMQVDA